MKCKVRVIGGLEKLYDRIGYIAFYRFKDSLHMNMPAYRQYPSKVPEDRLEREKFLLKLGLEHLLRARQWFECYQLGPYIAPYSAMAKEDYSKNDNLPIGIRSRGKITTHDGYKTIQVPGALTIYDFGDYLATSAGDGFGSTATGPMLKTVEHMMETLSQREANQVAFDDHCVDSAKIMATVIAIESDMLVYGFDLPPEQRKNLEEMLGRRLSSRQLAELTPESPE